jgi:hypothetical protein
MPLFLEEFRFFGVIVRVQNSVKAWKVGNLLRYAHTLSKILVLHLHCKAAMKQNIKPRQMVIIIAWYNCKSLLVFQRQVYLPSSFAGFSE